MEPITNNRYDFAIARVAYVFYDVDPGDRWRFLCAGQRACDDDREASDGAGSKYICKTCHRG